MKKIKNILILSGGDSSRFWPLKEKVVFPFFGKPLIEYIFRATYSYSHRLVIVCHPLIIDKVKKIVNDKALVISQDDISLGMAGAILSVKNIIKDEEALVINGSDLLDFSFLPELIEKIKDNYDLIITAKEVKDYFSGGYLKFDNYGQLIEIIEKPKPEKRPSSFIKLVADYFSRFNLLIQKINQFREKTDDLYERALTLLIKESKKTGVFYYKKDFYPLKYPWQVLNLTNYFLSVVKKRYFGRNICISKKATIIGPVYFDDKVKIGDYTKIIGPTFIGKNTVIADYVLINKSHIGEECLIGGYSEVTRSYLGKKVFLHRNYVGDSVLANKVLLGAGAVLANFRFDEQIVKSKINNKKIPTTFLKLGSIIGGGSKVGANSTILPGVKIGGKTFIGPGQLVIEDIDDNKFFFNNQLKNNFL